LDGYYTDKKSSIIDEKRLALFNKESEGPTHLGQDTGLAADVWLSEGSHAAATCVYSLLTAAAKADAWVDKMPQTNGIYMQNWLLSGTALAYLKVRKSGAGTAEQDALIQQWFRLLAAQVREYFDSGRNSREATLGTITCIGQDSPLPPRALQPVMQRLFCGGWRRMRWECTPSSRMDRWTPRWAGAAWHCIISFMRSSP
jgi:hypothetical protein